MRDLDSELDDIEYRHGTPPAFGDICPDCHAAFELDTPYDHVLSCNCGPWYGPPAATGEEHEETRREAIECTAGHGGGPCERCAELLATAGEESF